MEAQSGESVDGYTLENIELEYETIDNKAITADITKRFVDGGVLSFDHVTMLKSVQWAKEQRQ